MRQFLFLRYVMTSNIPFEKKIAALHGDQYKDCAQNARSAGSLAEKV